VWGGGGFYGTSSSPCADEHLVTVGLEVIETIGLGPTTTSSTSEWLGGNGALVALRSPLSITLPLA
jgi:hypothetical protein